MVHGLGRSTVSPAFAIRSSWRCADSRNTLTLTRTAPLLFGGGMKPQLKRIQTSQLDLAYLDEGDPKVKPVVLLHGWTDDPTSWTELSAVIYNRGGREILPYL